MKLNIITKALAVCAFLWGAAPAATSHNFVDFGPAEKFIEPEIHLLAGSSSVTQNYRSCFPEIKDLNINMGFSGGIGGSAVFGLSNFLGLGTSLDVMVNNYNIDMAVVGPNNLSVSSLFINNRAYYLNVPVFVSFRFNPMRSMRWIRRLSAPSHLPRRTQRPEPARAPKRKSRDRLFSLPVNVPEPLPSRRYRAASCNRPALRSPSHRGRTVPDRHEEHRRTDRSEKSQYP